MSKSVLVSLVSDQTLPNVLFIQAVKSRVDSFIFLVTEHTEKGLKTDTIIKACQLPAERITRISIDPESYPSIMGKLTSRDLNTDQHYILNITGGTKMMALAAKDFFERMPNIESFYIPVGHSKAYSLSNPGKEIELPELTLQQYLLAHAYTFEGSHNVEQPHNIAATLFKEVLRLGHAGKVSAITARTAPGYAEPDKKWYMGEWFEEWLYFKLKEMLRLPDSQICMKAKLKYFYSQSTLESDNEFDVIFVKNNKLFLVEAKVYTSENLKATQTVMPLYKIASQQSTLGLHANAIVIMLATLWNDPQRIHRINDLKRVLHINHVWDLEDMRDYHELFSKL